MDKDEVTQVPQLRKAPAERAAAAVLPASGLVWTAAEIMHAAGFPGSLDLGAATALSAAFAWGASGRWARIPRRLPWWIAAAGAWLIAAAAEGPLYGWPYPVLTAAWGAASLAAWRKARRHPSVAGAREWRQQRADWLSFRARRWGLRGSHLLAFERTALGEEYEVDTRGTGKAASQFATPHTEERIAEDENLAAVSRVHVKSHRPGRVRISVRREDPWARPLLHPLFDDDADKGTLPGPCSITGGVKIGEDPATRRPLVIPLCDETGAKCVGITAIRGSGKTVVLDDLSEGITRAVDALQIRINLSDKGGAEAESWGPACHLTAFGANQKARAVKVLAVANGILRWRSAAYRRGEFVPSPADPLVVVIIDESDSAMEIPALRREVELIATKGREHGVALVHVGQRGTADYSSAKVRSQDDVIVIGKVSRPGEVYHAAGSAGFTLPDMSVYGEGKPGVWGIAELGAPPQLGRAWIMGKTPAVHGAAVARIAQERAFAQPELPAACREFLGESYEILLSTDVFAKWARNRASLTPQPPSAPGSGGTAPSPSTVITATADDIGHLDFDMDLDDETRSRLAAIDAKNDRTRRMIEETAAMPKAAAVTPEALAAHTAERWRQVGDAAQIPEEGRPVLLRLLGEGTTISAVAEALQASRWDARTYLEKLRNEGIARLDGKGRGARWRLTGDGDVQ